MLKYNIFSTCKNCNGLFISKARTKEHVYCDICKIQMNKTRYARRKKYLEMKKQGNLK